MEKVFVDTDIILDLLGEREPFYKGAAYLFSKADKREIKIHISALSFANAHYVLRKQHVAREARKILQSFKVLVTVLPIDDKIIELALASDFSDFEDAIQYHAATENGMKTIVTRNLKDFRLSKIPVMTADGYLKTLN